MSQKIHDLIELATDLKQRGLSDTLIAAIILADSIESHAVAVRRIAHGDSAPTGLEMLSIAIAGERLHAPLSEAVTAVANALVDGEEG